MIVGAVEVADPERVLKHPQLGLPGQGFGDAEHGGDVGAGLLGRVVDAGNGVGALLRAACGVGSWISRVG